MAVKIEGTCDPRFSRVKEVFTDSFANGIEVGAAVAATLDGKSVIDLWGGHADKAKTRPWTRDTLVNVYSTTKGSQLFVRIGWLTRGSSISTRRLRSTGLSLRRRARKKSQ